VYGPLFPDLFLSPCPCLFPCLDLARVHDPCLPSRGQGQGQTKERELQRMSQGQIQTSLGHEVCYSHDHALFLCRVEAAAAASLTLPALRRHLVGRPSVGAQGDPELTQGLG
jgi:hypothetical protein